MNHWQSRGLLAWLLLPLAGLFYAIAAIRRALYRIGIFTAARLPVPVIVIGNITAGGTGKTPLVLALAQALAQAGHRPGIISRGYGARLSHPRAVPVNGDPANYGDEPCLLARRAGCSVWVGTDRASTARALLASDASCDVLISDDGLQHLALARDFEIAVIDGDRGFGNGWPLPAGPLREPIRRLRTVNRIVVNGGDPDHTPAIPGDVPLSRMHLAGDTLNNLADPALNQSLHSWSGKSVHAVAGIGHPPRFFAALRAAGLICREHPFPDHHRYTADDLAFGDDAPVVMTEKDAVKCTAFSAPHHWMLRVDATLTPPLTGDLIQLIRQRTTHG